jgi:hypothetical protein
MPSNAVDPAKTKEFVDHRLAREVLVLDVFHKGYKPNAVLLCVVFQKPFSQLPRIGDCDLVEVFSLDATHRFSLIGSQCTARRCALLVVPVEDLLM